MKLKTRKAAAKRIKAKKIACVEKKLINLTYLDAKIQNDYVDFQDLLKFIHLISVNF